MKYKEKLTKLTKQYGKSIMITIDGEPYETTAFFQPLRYKNKMYLDFERSELGIKDNTCILYLGPAEIDFSGEEDKTVFISEGRTYSATRADRIYIKNTVCYIWAILNPRIKDGTYDALQ